MQNTRLNAAEYLQQIYRTVDAGTVALLKFYADVYLSLNNNSALYLEFGGGPTIYSLISAAPKAKTIHFCDYSSECLSVVRAWKNQETNAFDWDEYIEKALEIELAKNNILAAEIVERKMDIQRKLTSFFVCNAHEKDMLPKHDQSYNIIANNFCLDGITSDKNKWVDMNTRLVKHLAPKGLYVSAALLNARAWKVGAQVFPAVSLDSSDLRELYRSIGLEIVQQDIFKLPTRDLYDGIQMIAGQKKRW